MLLFTVRVREAAESSLRQVYLNGAPHLLDRFAETKVLLNSSNQRLCATRWLVGD